MEELFSIKNNDFIFKVVVINIYVVVCCFGGVYSIGDSNWLVIVSVFGCELMCNLVYGSGYGVCGIWVLINEKG